MTKLCECGCGQPAPIAPKNCTRYGWIKGQPKRFVYNHHKRKPRPQPPLPPDEHSQYIALTMGQFTLVDSDDYERISQFLWFAYKNKYGRFYAATQMRDNNGKKTTVYMHRFILQLSADTQADHIDGDGLNNRRSNLRVSTQAENVRNQHVNRDSMSGYKGIIWHNRSGKWNARIRYNGKNISLRYHDSPEEAARAYDAAARELFGEFARLNFPLPGEQSALREE